jgi:integrase
MGGERYRVVPLGLADDLADAGPGILSFAAAARAAHAHVWDVATTTPPPRPGGMTVKDAIADYVSWLRDNRATAYDAERRAKVWITPKLGSKRIGELTTADIDRWLRWMVEQPALIRGGHRKALPTDPEGQRVRKSSANRVLKTLRAALTKAFRDGHVADDAAWRRVKPFAKVDARRPGFLSLDECVRLINAADEASGARDLLHAALLTGARYGELCNLRVRDFVAGKLHITRSKTGRARNIVLTQEGIEFFQQIAAGRAGTEYLLTRYGRPWQRSEQAKPMKEACEHARIVPAIGIHQLRHTYASLSVMEGMPLQVLAQNLGHASVKMIEAHYSHLRDDYVDEAIRAHAPRYGIVTNTNVTPLKKK